MVNGAHSQQGGYWGLLDVHLLLTDPVRQHHQLHRAQRPIRMIAHPEYYTSMVQVDGRKYLVLSYHVTVKHMHMQCKGDCPCKGGFLELVTS